MEFIKEESEEVKIEETIRVKDEEKTKEQTDLTALKEDTEVLNQMEEKDQFNNHYDFKTEEKYFSCSQTESTSSQNMAQKTGTISNFICQQFFCIGRFYSHMTNDTEKPFKCPQCGKSFNQKGHFKDHIRVHTGEKPYTCPQCGKSFNQKGSLNRHIKIHNSEKLYNCQQCGKSFIQKRTFKEHMRIHTGEKPFICGHCGKSFRIKETIKSHLRIHM